MRVLPGEPAADSQAILDAAREHLAAALERPGVADLDAAGRSTDGGASLSASGDRVRATREALLGDDAVAALRTRLAELRDAQPTDVVGDADGGTGRTRGRPGRTTARQWPRATSAANRPTRRRGRRPSRPPAWRCSGRSWTPPTRSSPGSAELLATQRQSATDDQLASRADAEAEKAGELAAATEAVEAELAGAAPAAVAEELDDAERCRCHRRARGTRRSANSCGTSPPSCRVYGTQGRKGSARCGRGRTAARRRRARPAAVDAPGRCTCCAR